MFVQCSKLVGFNQSIASKVRLQYFSTMFHNHAVHKESKTLNVILDLDETIVHSKNGNYEGDYNFNLGVHGRFSVYKRPHITEFLMWLEEHFTVGLYTAGMQDYADAVIDVIGANAIIPVERRLYRHHCIQQGPLYLKDLNQFGIPSEKILLIDNSPYSLLVNPKNGILCQSYLNEDHNCDTWLEELNQIAEKLAYLSDPSIPVNKNLPGLETQVSNLWVNGLGIQSRKLATSNKAFRTPKDFMKMN